MAAKRGRGRLPGFVMTAEHRGKIQKSNILKALIEHSEGRRDMSSTQVQAGLGLLRKIMPDMQATSFVDQEGNDLPTEITLTINRAKSKS